MASIKGRNFAFIVYPEHFPSLTQYEVGCKFAAALKVPMALSPLHTMSDEEEIKRHYHCMVCCSGNKTNVQIYAALLSSGLAGSLAGYKDSCTNSDVDNIIHLVSDRNAYMRYLIHYDNPDKEQFMGGFEDIKFYNGLDIGDANKLTKSETYKMMFEILEFVQREDIPFFCDLITYSMYNRYDDWFLFLSEHGSLVREFMRSKVAKVNYELKAVEINNKIKEDLS